MKYDYSEVIEQLRRALRFGESIDAAVVNEAIEYIENTLTSELSQSDKIQCQTQLSHLLSIRARYEEQGSGLGDEVRIKWEDVKSAFGCRIRSGQVVNLAHKDIIAFLKDAFIIFEEQIKLALTEHSMLKVYTELAAEYMSLSKEGEELYSIKYFNTKAQYISQTTNLREWFISNVQKSIFKKIEEFQDEGSGWTLSSILHLAVHINKYNPARACSYIPLPKCIQNRKACVNVQNFDDRCFMWAILSAIHPQKKNNHRYEPYKAFENELNFSGIDFPVKIKDIPKFEKMNNISVNLYILKQKVVEPIHLTALKHENHVNLLLIQDRYDDDDDDVDGEDFQDSIDDKTYIPINYHYVWIKNLSRLVSSQLSKKQHEKHICDRCLHFFHMEADLVKHEKDCSNINKCKILLPDENNNKLTFENYLKKEWVPFIIYGDFECMLKPVKEPSNPRAYSEHEALSVGFYLKCNFDDEQSEYRCYRKLSDNDMSPSKWFVQNLQNVADKVLKFFDNPMSMRFTRVEKIQFEKAETCHICMGVFSEEDIKVRDHNHFTGEYRGAAHNKCNINYKDKRFVPVIFHNLSRYDSHLFIREVAIGFPGRVSVLPQTKERYISFVKFMEDQKFSFRFIDSFKFMASSLDKLASYLNQLPTLEKVFAHDYNNVQINLLKRKGVFPYEYVSSLEKLQETVLPPLEHFHSSLTDSDISSDDYEHAKRVWDSFGISTLGEYSDLYLKTDVLLFVEVFENFRKTCHEAYQLDPAHYYTTPGYSWDAMLLYTQVQLELLTDIDMLLFIEKGIRGGVSQCCSRYAEANNKYMGDEYDPAKEDVYLMYYDINNLYGWAMVQSLPYGGFQWDDAADYLTLPENSEHGYILEVDLEYPKAIHDLHKDLPLCPEHARPPGSKQRKLLTTLNDKYNYVIHYRSLQQAVRLGVRVKKVHRALRFKQGPWLKAYIDLNTEKRKNAKNDFEKQQFKLINNAIFGKTMENVRKRIDVKLISKWKGRYGAEARISMPNFHSRAIFDENLVAIQLSRTAITIDKPVYVGLSILDMSKTLVYRFHYDYMRDRFGSNCKVLYTDTDSLVYEIRNQDVYEVMKLDIHEFDTYDYPADNQFKMPRPRENSKKLGLMKDECNSRIIRRFCGLRSKMYSVDIRHGDLIKKIKGVKSSVVKNTITFEDYVQCLRENAILSREQHNIRSRLHVLRSEKEQKIALSPHDDKRYLVPGTTDTLPWGHKDIASEPPAMRLRLE